LCRESTICSVSCPKSDGPGRPIAAPLERCTELLGVDLVTIREAATNVEPYMCVDGTRIWSLMLLERQLRPEPLAGVCHVKASRASLWPAQTTGEAVDQRRR
jgi:hypothetical protein